MFKKALLDVRVYLSASNNFQIIQEFFPIHNIVRLVFVMSTQCVFFEVGIEFP